MADSETSLLSFLISKTSVKAAFGSSNTRIYVDRKDEAITTAYPYAIIRTVTEAPEYAHDGNLPDVTLFQIDIYSDAKSTANSGAAAIRAELDGYKGTLGSITAGSSFIQNVRGGFDPDSRTFYRSTDILISQNG